MPSIFSYQSAEVDWCESNFVRSAVIAEYYNTISNVSFFLLSPALLYLNRQYCQKKAVPLYFVSGLLILVGLFSMYFHMTLSYVGQLLDELSILWTLAVAYSFWYPQAYFPKCIKTRYDQRDTVRKSQNSPLSWSCLCFWISDRWLCWLWQAINFPYFHSFWHVLIALSLLYCCPLVIYFDVSYEMPSFKPKLEYWPSDSWPVVVPYVTLEEPHKQC
uniref:Alkaline ceramidase n=1 Tax=Zonotrichia albicollis TaxID=44394 RepID=A0A8D2QE13_ZONAL